MANYRVLPREGDPTPYTYEQEVYAAGLHSQRPQITFDSTAWQALAKGRLSAEADGYLNGNAGTGETYAKNLAAFQKWTILPSRLVPADFPNLKTKLPKIGAEIPYPIALAPVGVLKIFHRDGEIAAAVAAQKHRVPYILSTAASTSIEDVAKANADGIRWYQLYWPANEHNDITVSLLGRARNAGYSALVVTLDAYMLGWRPHDMDNGYNPFLRADNVGVELGFSDPVYQAHFKKEHGKEIHEDVEHAAIEWAKIVFPGKSHGWEDVKFLQKHWDGPIILKGIQSLRDARKAAEIGVQGIVVSNHGGRQLDGGVASLDMLQGIAQEVGDKVDILFDSGIRCGADIVKALSLGARAVLIGRPFVYGLALAGTEGVSHVLRSLLGELDLTLHLAGAPSLDKKDVNEELLVRESEAGHWGKKR